MLSWRHQSHSDAHSDATRTSLDRPVRPRHAGVHMVRPRRHRRPQRPPSRICASLQRVDAGAMDLPPPRSRPRPATAGRPHRRSADPTGVSRAQIRWRLGRAWRLLLPGIILSRPGLPTGPQSSIAALLYAGPQTWLSGPTALRLHRWAAERARAVESTSSVPPPIARATSHGSSIRRSSFTDERARRTRSAQLLVPAASGRGRAAGDVSGRSERRALIIEAVQRRLVRLDDVSHWIEVRRPEWQGRPAPGVGGGGSRGVVRSRGRSRPACCRARRCSLRVAQPGAPTTPTAAA